MATVPAEGHGCRRLNTLRTLIQSDPDLAAWPPLANIFGAFVDDDQFATVLENVRPYTQLGTQSRATLDLVSAARDVGLPHKATLIEVEGRYELQLEMIYFERKRVPHNA